jgi:hypothetical protein
VPIDVICSCGRKLRVREEFAGQEGKCPACGVMFRIPHPDTAAAGPASPATPQSADLTTAPAAGSEPPPAPPGQDAELRTHAGDALLRDADFFHDPPAEIGPLLSAHTTLRRGQQPWSPAARAGLALCLSAIGLVAGLLICAAAEVRSSFGLFAWPAGLALLVLLIVYLATGFRHTCTYVGRHGIARFVCSGSRDRIQTAEVFRFDEATDLRTSQTLRYVNGVYQNTTYNFTWHDINGRARYRIGGTHNSQAGTPPGKHPYHWARAAELAWTYHLLDQASRQLELSGSVLFHLPGGRWIRLGDRRLRHNLSGSEEEWEADDIQSVTVQQGVVTLRRKGAREGWFSSEGVVKFDFAQLGNAQLFFHLLEKVVGVPVE